MKRIVRGMPAGTSTSSLRDMAATRTVKRPAQSKLPKATAAKNRSGNSSAASRRRVERKVASVSGRVRKLPGWKELGEKSNSRIPKFGNRPNSLLETINTRHFVLTVLLVATGFTVYVGHVQATQGLLSEVQALRQENLDLNLKFNRLKGEFDQMTGPSVIYDRAREMGLEEDIRYGPTIRIE